MDELLPEEQHRARPHRQRRRVGEGEEPLRDAEVVPRGAVIDEVAPMAAGMTWRQPFSTVASVTAIQQERIVAASASSIRTPRS